MRRTPALVSALAVLALAASAGIALAQAPMPAPMTVPAPAKTVIKAADGKILGEAAFTAGSGGVLIQVSVSGLTPGWHGMHLHAVGDCSDPKFTTAGGHINMAGMDKKEHGLLNPKGPDFGDLPNLYVGADGKGMAQAFTTLVNWDGMAGGKMALKDADGSALVIHANADDGVSQPIGGAGDRVACSVIK